MQVLTRRSRSVITALLTVAFGCGWFVAVRPALAQQGTPVRPVGVVKSVSGRTVVLTTDAGGELQVVIPESARLVRVAPGQKDLKGAAPIQLQDVQVGDRMLARGSLAEDGKSVVAASVVVMKGGDIAQRQQREREDWEKRGVGGLVKSVDPTGGTLTLSSGGMAGKDVIVRVSSTTLVRRYAPDSVKFDDARPANLEQIKPGDQLRARGARNADGSTIAAEEIVSGSFRNIAGTVLSVDAGTGIINVADLATKKTLALRTTPDSQLRALPAMFAQRIAARLRGPSAAPPSSGAGASEAHRGSAAPQPDRAPDFQQMINRMPQAQLSDLRKGDAVMIVATEGTASSPPTAITLLTGVEPILSAAPASDGAAMLLSPWSLGGGDSGSTP